MQRLTVRPAASVLVACAFCTAANARHITSAEALPADTATTGDSITATGVPPEEGESDTDGSVDNKTMALAIVAAILITFLVIYGFYKMCRSGSAAERAVQLFKFDKSGRADPARGAYVRHADDDVLPTRAKKTNSLPANGGLPTIPSEATL